MKALITTRDHGIDPQVILVQIPMNPFGGVRTTAVLIARAVNPVANHEINIHFIA
jgi:hypothetical protein